MTPAMSSPVRPAAAEMRVWNDITEGIGNTPLVRLNRLAAGTKADLLVKLESLNPGGSVKDRIGKAMIEQAEAEGRLRPGGTIIEATAGNTGVGLALAAAVKGYRCIFVMPDKMSEDKVNLLRAYGAEVVITPTSVAPDSPESYNGVADRLAREIPGAWRANQFANPVNPRTHYDTTGPEIWADTAGRVDVLVAGMGTGGTISGTGAYLKEKNPAVRVIGADPEGSILSGDYPKSYKVEGIGEDFIPATFNRQVIDEMIRIGDAESFTVARRLAREEGLLVGGSSGTAVAAALRYAQRLTEPKVIVAICTDTGRNYISRFFSNRWMRENGFAETASGRVTLADVFAARGEFPKLLALRPTDTLARAVALMHEHGVSQLPVIGDDGRVAGSVSEGGLLKLLSDGANPATQTVGTAMGKPLPALEESTEVAEAYRLLLTGSGAILVLRDGSPATVVSRIDLIEFWAAAGRRNGG